MILEKTLEIEHMLSGAVIPNNVGNELELPNQCAKIPDTLGSVLDMFE